LNKIKYTLVSINKAKYIYKVDEFFHYFHELNTVEFIKGIRYTPTRCSKTSKRTTPERIILLKSNKNIFLARFQEEGY
jgi:hypothetical protein